MARANVDLRGLCITLKLGQTVQIGEDIKLAISMIGKNQVKVVFACPNYKVERLNQGTTPTKQGEKNVSTT